MNRDCALDFVWLAKRVFLPFRRGIPRRFSWCSCRFLGGIHCNAFIKSRLCSGCSCQAGGCCEYDNDEKLACPARLKDKVVRARRTRYIPVVLTREEVVQVIQHLAYPFDLAAGLLYGCGLRLFECLNLRISVPSTSKAALEIPEPKNQTSASPIFPPSPPDSSSRNTDRCRFPHCGK